MRTSEQGATGEIGASSGPPPIDYREVSLLLMDLIVTGGIWQSRNASDETSMLCDRWLVGQMNRLAEALQVSGHEKAHLLRFQMFQRLDAYPNNSAERLSQWDTILSTLRREVAELGK